MSYLLIAEAIPGPNTEVKPQVLIIFGLLLLLAVTALVFAIRWRLKFNKAEKQKFVETTNFSAEDTTKTYRHYALVAAVVWIVFGSLRLSIGLGSLLDLFQIEAYASWARYFDITCGGLLALLGFMSLTRASVAIWLGTIVASIITLVTFASVLELSMGYGIGITVVAAIPMMVGIMALQKLGLSRALAKIK